MAKIPQDILQCFYTFTGNIILKWRKFKVKIELRNKVQEYRGKMKVVFQKTNYNCLGKVGYKNRSKWPNFI